ncbi:MAG: hypothetical protein HY559_04030 [Gammaproteobacteria bacterium]|nr:hypothetical protein [Gammaproteobacteria bacterium]
MQLAEDCLRPAIDVFFERVLAYRHGKLLQLVPLYPRMMTPIADIRRWLILLTR